jgi:hypothetical protein
MQAPGAAEGGTSFKYFDRKAERAQVVELVYARKACSDDEGIESFSGNVHGMNSGCHRRKERWGCVINVVALIYPQDTHHV